MAIALIQVICGCLSVIDDTGPEHLRSAPPVLTNPDHGWWGRHSIPSNCRALMMPHTFTLPPAFWDTVAEHVTARVRPVLRQRGGAREPIIAYLRDLEAIARRECDSRAAIQVIASGRHLLGDRSDIGPVTGPFSRT